MAEKFERTYNVPLRRGFIKAPIYKKAKKAVSTLKDFIRQHTKADVIKIGPELNKRIWGRGMKNPPHHVKVTAIKEENIAKVELEGTEFKALKPKKKEEKKPGLKGKLEALTKGKEEKKEEKPKEKKEEEKKETKKEVKKSEEKKEKPETKKQISGELKKEETKKTEKK